MSRTTRRADRLLIISRSAGGMNPEAEAKLRTAFADHTVIAFNPRTDFTKLITPDARVVVAGGDGTVEFVVRKLADSKHPLGIVPVGTFNNLAHALHLPEDLDAAIEVIRHGMPRAITVGRVNGQVFVEACAVGLFGDAIIFGDAAKDLEFGTTVQKLKDLVVARPFHYKLSGDLRGEGDAMSLVFSNTSSIGMQLPVSDSDPMDSYLEFAADAGQSQIDIVRRVVASTVLSQHEAEGSTRLYRFRKLHVSTSPRVRVYADNQPAGRTPATVTADVSALRVLVPGAGNHK